MTNPKYLLNKTGSEVDNILSNAESHIADDSVHMTEENKAKLNSALQNITTSDGSGLNITKSLSDINIEIDDTVTFILNCGNSIV